MAIIVRGENGEVSYVSATGSVSDYDKKIADEIDADLSTEISKLEKIFLNEGLIDSNGSKKDALQVWYRTGLLLNHIGDKFNIIGTSDEPYFWDSIYYYASDILQKGATPQRSKDSRRNHFKLCGYMARKEWKFVKDVGNWSVWRDLLDNIRLQEDPRIFEWVIDSIHRAHVGHKELRPFIHHVRRMLKNKNTLVLSDKEVESMLVPSLTFLPSKTS